MTTVTGFTAARMLEIEDNTIVGGSIVANELVLVTKDGTEINLGNVVESPSGNNSDVVILGKTGEFGTAQALDSTASGERLETVGSASFDFEPGMGPFFSQILPDGTIAMPQIQLPVNQLTNTGKTMSMAFWSQHESAFYTVVVPTSTGQLEVLSVNTISGVVGAAGGADLSDCAVVTIAGQTVLFALSAVPYRGWNVSVYGEYPTLAAFVKSEETGRWVYSEPLSIFPAELQASDPVNGASAWPNSTNYYAETVVNSKLPAEITVLPQSGFLALSIYGPRTGQNSGAVIVVDPEAKTQVAYYEFPDFESPSGATFRAFPRDLSSDPTSDIDDERILLNFDTFTQPNEIFNIVVAATTGTFTVSWAGSPTTSLAVGISEKDMQAALEAIAGIGVGNVNVRLFRPFLVSTYSVYECQLIGAKRASNYSATSITIDTSLLITNNNSRITRWQTGGTGFTKPAPFPMVELAYNATAGTLDPVTTLLLPQGNIFRIGYPELLELRFSHSWIDAEGTAWMSVRGANSNPEASTTFSFRGLHAWRKTAGERRYVTDHPPLAGWEDRYGEAQPYPDLNTYGLHNDTNCPILSISEDVASGGIIAASSGGTLKLTEPISMLANRTGNLFSTTAPTAWAILGGASHSGVWNGTELAYELTAGSTTNMEGRSPTGLSGIAIPESYEGQLLQVEIDVKSVATPRAIQTVVHFYDAAGAAVSPLTGYGPAKVNSITSAYKTIVGSVVVPVGARFVSLGAVVENPAIAEVHYVKRAIMYLAACNPIPDIVLSTTSLYVGATGAAWLAKGFVDPDTRRLWLPFLQQMSTALALNVVRPAWLISVNLSNVFRDRRPSAARQPIAHAETHEPGGTDPLDFAPIDDPSFTGQITVETGAVAGTPDIKGSALLTAGLRWDATLGLIIITGSTDRWRVGTTGALVPIAHNTYDVGAATNRLKDIHVGGKIYLASTTLLVASGAGSPEGVTTSSIGGLYLDSTNGVLWAKGSGTGNTGWYALSHIIFNRQTASYTLVLADRNKCVEINAAGANDWIIPTNAAVAFPIGTVVNGAQYGAGLTTISAPGVTLRSRGGLLISGGQYARWKAEKVATDEWYISGDLA